jgi:hypothetical protein
VRRPRLDAQRRVEGALTEAVLPEDRGTRRRLRRLTHERPYKAAWRLEDAVAEVRRLAGRQFDPALVAAFESLDHELLAAPAG